MNNSKIWLVVRPTVGVPLFLSAVAIGSFAVHVAVLTNTGWVSDFLSGRPLGTTAAIQAPMNTADADAKARIYFETSTLTVGEANQEATIVLPDGRTAKAVFSGPLNTAAADLGAPPRQPRSE